MASGKLYFNTVEKNSQGTEIINPTKKELQNYNIPEFVPSGNRVLDIQLQSKITQMINCNRDSFSKSTLYDVLNNLFEVIPMANNSNLLLYGEILKNIKTAKESNEETILLSKDDIEKLKKIFENPPEKPELNRIIYFVLECLDKTHIETLES